MDNGFLQLTNVRSPRDQLLMKYTKVFFFLLLLFFLLFLFLLLLLLTHSLTHSVSCIPFQVLQDGTCLKSTNEKISYGTMVLVRAFLVMELPNILARTVTIAVRYSVVRRQTKHKPE